MHSIPFHSIVLLATKVEKPPEILPRVVNPWKKAEDKTWSLESSVFASFRQETQDLLQEAFDADWNSSEVGSLHPCARNALLTLSAWLDVRCMCGVKPDQIRRVVKNPHQLMQVRAVLQKNYVVRQKPVCCRCGGHCDNR